MIYLYVKQHAKTKLKYFGKTANNRDPYKYTGSGKYWISHINKHGKEFVETIHVWEFDTAEDCKKFAFEFSHTNNIVESHEWANLRAENGVDGAPVGCLGSQGMLGKKHTKESRKKMSDAAKGRKISDEHKALLLHWATKTSGHNKGKKWTTDTKKRMSESHKGKKWYNNGVEEIKTYVEPGCEWVKGRLLKREGMKWFNNSIENRMFYHPPDDTWIPGMIKKT